MAVSNLVEIPPVLLSAAKSLKSQGCVRLEDASHEMILLEELGHAMRSQRTGPTPPRPRSSIKLAHKLRPGDHLEHGGRSFLLIGVTHESGKVWLNAHGLPPGRWHGMGDRVKVLDGPIRAPEVWYELRLTKEACVFLELWELEHAGDQSHESQPSAPQWLGEDKVSIDGQIVVLADRAACVLQALVELQAASGTQLSERSGITDAVKVLKRICNAHPALAEHIIFPGGKGKGGYRTTIVDASGGNDQQTPS